MFAGRLRILCSKEAPLFRIICDDRDRIGDFVSGKVGMEGWSNFRAIGLEKDGELIAGVVYDNYNKATIFMHIAAKPGRKWLTRNFLWFMWYYPFVQLGVKRVTGIIPLSNKDSINFANGLKGARLEALLKDAHPDGDMAIYCMFKQDCKYLGIFK